MHFRLLYYLRSKYYIMNRSNVFAILGFTFFIVGFLSLILYLVGARLSFLVWMDYWGAGFGLILRLCLLIAGFILAYLSKVK